MTEVRPLAPAEALRRLDELCALLRDAVEDGASIGFLAPLAGAEAEAYWEGVVEALAGGRSVLLAALADGRVVGAVQLGLEARANGRHRAELMKLMVLRAQRRRGIGRALMGAALAEADRSGAACCCSTCARATRRRRSTARSASSRSVGSRAMPEAPAAASPRPASTISSAAEPMPEGATLTPPAPGNARSYLAALREGFRRGMQPVVAEPQICGIEADFERHIARLAEPTGSIILPNGEVVPKVPFSLRWLVEGAEFIGEVSIRHRLNDWLRQEGGHVGYGIRPSRQRRGYGRLILALALEECRGLGLERVLVTADADNLASIRIIEANGGRLEDEIGSPFGGGRLRRYWITLREDG